MPHQREEKGLKFATRLPTPVKALFDTIILLGSLQGFIIAWVLLYRGKENYAAKIIAWLLLVLASACLKIYLNNIGALSSEFGAMIDAVVPFMIIMAVGPLIYFYCRSELDPEFRIRRKEQIHFYPVAVDVFHHACALVLILLLLAGVVKSGDHNFGRWFDTYNVYADVPRWLSLSIYLYLSFKLVSNYSKNSKGNPLPHAAWLKEFLWVMLVFDALWFCYLVPYIIPSLTDKLLGWVDWYPIYLPLVLLIYWLGIRSLLINRDYISKNASKSMPPEMLEKTTVLLQKAMTTDKLYLDPELTLSKLATHVGVSSKLISAGINHQSGKSFNEYINFYRVEEFKAKILHLENKKYTIVALAFECGFNSQPTFQRAFKNLTGITPSEFAQQHGASV